MRKNPAVLQSMTMAEYSASTISNVPVLLKRIEMTRRVAALQHMMVTEYGL